MFDLTISALASLLRDRKVSSEELARLFLGRIARLDPGLNAFITVDEEKALAAARAADARLARGDGAPLTGIPIAHKDLFCAKGWKTTCGSRMLADFVSPYDAHVVEQFDRAGAVLLGKTNMDEFAMGSSNENSHFGPVRNPWDRTRVPGRKLRRLGRGGGRAPRAGGDGHRHRRLHPPARVAHRHLRHPADLRRGVALRHGRLRLVARPGRRLRQERRGPRADAERDGRLRRARLHQHRAAEGGLRPRPGAPARGPARRAPEGVLHRGPLAGRRRVRHGRRSTS